MLSGKKRSYLDLKSKPFASKTQPFMGMGTYWLIAKWKFDFLFVTVPLVCKTTARRRSGWAKQDSGTPWVLPPNSAKRSRPNNHESGSVGRKEPRKSMAGEEEPLTVSEQGGSPAKKGRGTTKLADQLRRCPQPQEEFSCKSLQGGWDAS